VRGEPPRGGRERPVQPHEDPSASPRRRRVLRIPAADAEFRQALGPGYDVVSPGSAERPDIVVADLRGLRQLAETRRAYPEARLVIRLPFGATATEVVEVLDSGADACLVDGPIVLLAAQVRSVDRASRTEDLL
jgi:hypothetical protein